MFRPLTPAESKKATAAKREANKILKRGTQLSRAYEAATLGEARSVKGRPVIISIQGCQIYVDYSKLRKLAKLLNPRQWKCLIDVKKVPERGGGTKLVLAIQYKKEFGPATGGLELYELPNYQRELLTDLPVIEVCQRG